MYRKILVPLDHSEFAEAALPAALSLAERNEGELHLVHVVSTLPPLVFSGHDDAGGPGWFDEGERRGKGYLESVVKRLREAGAEVEIHTKLLHGNPVRMIHDWVLKTGIDQIVMTTHGRGRLQRLWLGSVADGLVRSVPCPILLRKPSGEVEGVDLADRPGYGRILVPLDGSEIAEAIVPWAVRLGKLHDAPVTLLSVQVTPTAPASSYLPHAGEEEASRLAGLRRAEDYLLGIAERIRDEGVEADFRVLGGENAASAILDHAEKVGADLIALSTHGHGGITRMVVGSVADKLIRGSEAHLLIHLDAEEG